MAWRVPLHLHGAVDVGLLENLEDFQDVWVAWQPDHFGRITIDVDEELPASCLDRAPPPGGRSEALLLFSGGLDSTHQLVAHQQRAFGRRSRDVVAAVMVHGADIDLGDDEAWDRARRAAEPVLADRNVPLVTVATDWRRCGLNWIHVFGAAMAGCLHHLSDIAGIGLFAPDDDWGHPMLGHGSNPVTDPMLSSSRFRVETPGRRLTRLDRLAELARLEPALLDGLRVCWQAAGHGGNCGRCFKCRTTQLATVALGLPPIPTLGAVATPDETAALTPAASAGVTMLSALVRQDDPGLPDDLRGAATTALRRAAAEWRLEQVLEGLPA